MFTTIKNMNNVIMKNILQKMWLSYIIILWTVFKIFKPVRNNYICFVTILIFLIYKITDNSIMNIHEYSKISFISTECVWICFVSADNLEPYKIW